ncbi:hypothetical protein [Chryseolinea soli]|uniref:hypothetical protein n=1 Tax=Chryseolinea soli TaxID=2321403 RepID=UPI00135B2C2F|nr:hypothetical protein [Chryseolinea soli]
MIYYKLIFGIIFFCSFTLLLIRTGKKSHYSFLYLLGRLEILVGIAAGLFLIITAFKG